MRRLPVFFVLDCSESMVGKNLQNMEAGLQEIVRSLRTDPHALDTVHISILAFAGMAKTISPLTEIATFYPPKLPLGGGTNLGDALRELMSEIDSNVVRTTADRKGDWKPIVYLFTDGRPTDKPQAAIKEWNSNYANKVTLIAVGLGKFVDFAILNELTDHVLLYEESAPEDFKKFVDWVTASIVTSSKSVGDGVDAEGLPQLDKSILSLEKKPLSSDGDEACVTLVGRCQKNREPYIIKYDRVSSDLSLPVPLYEIAGCYPLEESFFEWSAATPVELKVNTSELVGAPGCPHCGNITAFAACGCGKLMCVNGPSEATCPWCEQVNHFLPGGGGEGGGFEVERGRG